MWMQNHGYAGQTVELYSDFQLWGGAVPPNPALFEGQLYVVEKARLISNKQKIDYYS